jgi:hypothetical protein
MLLAALMAANVATAGSTFPIESILDEARSSCEIVFGSENPEAALSSAGGESIQPQPGTWIAQELKQRWDSVGTPHRQFAKEASGRVVFLIFGTDPDPRLEQTICSVREPKAVLNSDADRVVRWAKQAPLSPAINLPTLKGMDEVGFTKRWSPGLGRGSDETMVNYAKGFGLSFFAVKYRAGTAAK